MIATCRHSWMVFRGILSTAYATLAGLFLMTINRYQHADGNRILRHWGERLLAHGHIHYTLHKTHQTSLSSDRCYIIMSNHASRLDIPILFASMPFPIRMVAKKELFRVPFWGKAMRRAGIIAIDRHNREQAIKDLKNAQQFLTDSGIALWISPEGTRSRDGQLQPFKLGGFRLALDTQAIIIPVAICGAHTIEQATRDAQKNQHHVDVYMGEPIDTQAFQHGDRQALKQLTFERIQQLMETTADES